MMNSRKQALEQSYRFDSSRTKFNSRPYDIQNLYVSLKQWRLLHAVVDCGGYAEAAKALHLSQSTISYAIAKLQDLLGVPLLRIEGRKAVLTVEGRTLLERSRNVLKQAVELEIFARNLSRGWGGEVQLVVDHNFPSDLLMQALRKFTAIGNGAGHVKLHEVAALQAEDALRDPHVDLVIGERVPLGYLGEPIAEVEYIPVASPEHPLLKLRRDVKPVDFLQHIQIGIGQPNEVEKAGASGPLQGRRWRMNSFDSVVAAVREGLGYAWLPQHRLRQWLDEKTLARIPLEDVRSYKSILYLIHGHPWAITPSVSQLTEVLRTLAAESEGAAWCLNDPDSLPRKDASND